MDETIAGIKYHLPDAHIIIMADGIWDKLAFRHGQYEEYLNRIDRKYSNTQVIRFPQHTQQTAMAQYAIQNFVKTKLIWWNEHDATLRVDRSIDWDAIVNEVESGTAGLVRLSYFDEGIHEAHEHMTRGRYRIGNATFVKTTQFSGWLFLTTIDFFISKIFSGQPIGRQMLELRMHDIIANSPWEAYKIVTWCPDGPAQRFRHTNGRGAGVEVRDPCDWS